MINIVLIYDEVYSGWCKTGNLFYFMNFKDVEPDVLTSGKSLGGGKASISAYTCKNKIFKKSYDNLRDATLHSTTFNALGEETITAIEAIKKAEKENCYVIRLVEQFGKTCETGFELQDNYKLTETNLMEWEEFKTIERDEKISFKPFEIKTYKIKGGK